MNYRIILTENKEVGFQIQTLLHSEWKAESLFGHVGGRCPSISFKAFEHIKALEKLGYKYKETINMKTKDFWQ